MPSVATPRSRFFVLSCGVLLAAACGPAEDAEFAPRGAGLLPAGPATLTGAAVFEGTYVRRHADFFDGRGETWDVLVEGARSVRLLLEEHVDRNLLDPGARLRVHGEADGDGRFHVTAIETLAPPPARAIDPEKRPARRIAWIQVYWDGKDGLSKENAKARLFTGDESTNALYQQMSFGKERLAGDVYGWFQIPDPGGNPDAIATAAQQALQDYGVPLWQYDQFMYYFPFDGSFGWAGLANLGSPLSPAPDSWYNGAAGCVVLAQELAHNYGLVHSNNYSCVDENGDWAPYSDNCEENEYGDPFEPMGSGCGHFNVFQKGTMGWLEGCNSVTALGDGTFNLVPQELPCEGIQALRIPIEGTPDYYYLEYRQPLGFDGSYSGVLVRVARNYGSTNPKLLDMFDGPGWYLQEGVTYDDHQGRVSFTVVEMQPTHAVIQVSYPDGKTDAPTCMDGSMPTMEMGAYGSLECVPEPVGPDDSPPEVTITYPNDGDVFEPGADFTITAEATDDREVTDVRLYVNGEPFYLDIEPPFEWPVTDIPEGDYEFGVVARDGVNWTPSQAVRIRVGAVAGTTGAAGSSGGVATDGDETVGGTGGTDGEAGTDDDTGGAVSGAQGCSCRAGRRGASGAPWGMPGLVGIVGVRVRMRRRRKGREPRSSGRSAGPRGARR